jgi:hypothetical protein
LIKLINKNIFILGISSIDEEKNKVNKFFDEKKKKKLESEGKDDNLLDNFSLNQLKNMVNDFTAKVKFFIILIFYILI